MQHHVYLNWSATNTHQNNSHNQWIQNLKYRKHLNRHEEKSVKTWTQPANDQSRYWNDCVVDCVLWLGHVTIKLSFSPTVWTTRPYYLCENALAAAQERFSLTTTIVNWDRLTLMRMNMTSFRNRGDSRVIMGGGGGNHPLPTTYLWGMIWKICYGKFVSSILEE